MLQKGYLGNIAWDVLQNAHVDKWTTFAGGDKDLFETMISITGTVILSMPKNNNQTGPGGIGAKNPETKTVDYTIDMNDLINKHQRKNIEILRCKPADGDPTGVKCLNMVPEQPPNFQSMVDRIKGVLIGDANNGLVYKFRHPAIGQKMTVKEKALTELMPMPMIKMIRSFGTEGDSSAKFFTEKTIPIIAEAMVESFIEDMIRVFSDAKHSAPPAMRVRIPKFEALLAEADNRNFKIIQANAAKFNKTLDFFKTFETLRANSKKKKLLFKQLSQTKRNGD